MSKLSKIQSFKQEKKYKNETMNMLNHLNSKATTPTLADKSLHAFKSIKPEVQSSRLNRPDYSKIYGKSGVNYYVGYSREKDRGLEISEKIEKISSKSLQSRQSASHNTYRKQNEKTKKNSYSRLHTDMGNREVKNNWEKFNQCSVEERLKSIENIFVFNQIQASQKLEDLSLIQSPSIRQIKKNISSLQLSKNGFNSKIHNQLNLKSRKSSVQMITDLKYKFGSFESAVQERKKEMIYDEIDMILSKIFSGLKNSFISILDALLLQNQQKMLNIEMSLQKIMYDHRNQIEKLSKKQEKIKQSYSDQIENMLIRSLYMIDKINILQEKGILHFEKEARSIDGENYYNNMESNRIGREYLNQNYNIEEKHSDEDIGSENFEYNPPHRQQEPFYFISGVSQSYREIGKIHTKYNNPLGMVKNLR